ncbi:hypothetical protein [Lentibacillus jeotgali]|uniref:hypothetical protein n=1 Tax=Lentibacillus jeotgali TaxID=558169 RepID=UPI0002628C31|nr:hypothetical protein [Lentibacillus jeotgali]
MGRKLKHATWAEAKKRCRLNQADIQMAKELGMKPKSLIKNIPAPKEHWKAPVKIWVRDLYEEKFGELLKPDKTVQKKSGKQKKKREDAQHIFSDEELPF